MWLDLTKIRSQRERYENVYSAEQVSDDRETFRVLTPVTLEFDIFKDKDHFRLIGGVKTTLELLCGRCLEPFSNPVDGHFDLRYQPHVLNKGEGEREIEEDDLSTAFYENETIDLGQLMREQFYLSLPMKPLCSPDCRGLCPVCGTNLNAGTCQCKREWEDPRFAALKVLKKDDQDRQA